MRRPNALDSGAFSTPREVGRRRGRSGAAQHVVAPDALAAVDVPAEERAVEPQRAELERRAAQHLAGAAARVVVVLADPQLEPGAALVAVAVVGGREARVGDRAPRRPASSSARPRASSAWLSAPAGRTRRVDHAPAPSSSHAPSERVSAIRSQSGAPHERPRWPRQSIARAPRRACRARGTAARSPPSRRPRASTLAAGGEARLELELEARARSPANAPASARAARRVRTVSPGRFSVVPVRVRRPRGRPRPPAPTGSRAREQHAERAALRRRRRAPSAREPEEPALAVGERERDRVGEALGRRSGARLAHGVLRGRCVGVDVDRGALDVVRGPRPVRGPARGARARRRSSAPRTRRTSSRAHDRARRREQEAAAPKMSVMKPGVSRARRRRSRARRRAPRAPAARPACSASLKRRHAIRPCERISIEPRIESAIRSAIVHQTPIAWPTWMITASSAIGTTMKMR